MTRDCSQCPYFELCSASPENGCPLEYREAVAIHTFPREIVERWEKNRRRAYHVVHDAKNIFEDWPIEAAAEIRRWHSIACTARLALLSLGAETKEMTGMKEIVEGLRRKWEQAKQQADKWKQRTKGKVPKLKIKHDVLTHAVLRKQRCWCGLVSVQGDKLVIEGPAEYQDGYIRCSKCGGKIKV